MHLTNLPANFSWTAYLLWNSDLIHMGIQTKPAAEMHYIASGYAGGRLHSRIPVLLRYTACQGLFNQMYAHLAAFVLAEALGADVALPPSLRRQSFAQSIDATSVANLVKWFPTESSALLNFNKTRDSMEARGMKLYDAVTLQTADCNQPDSAFPVVQDHNVTGEYDEVVRLGGIYLKHYPLSRIWEWAAVAIREKYVQLRKRPNAPNRVVLDLPATLFSISTLGDTRDYFVRAAKCLHFNPDLLAMRDVILKGMMANGITAFNGAHMRFEGDASAWTAMLGGRQGVWRRYFTAFQQGQFGKDKPLYVASGLLTYGAKSDLDEIINNLEPYSKSVCYKEMYVEKEALNKLSSEQQALLDFLVLAKSDKTVGMGVSTFYVFLREWRALHGISRANSIFVDDRKIGTDAVFQRAAYFAPEGI